MIPDLKIVTEANLQTLLSIEDVSLMELYLGHQKMTVSISGVNVVQNMLESGDCGLEVTSQKLGLGQEIESILEPWTCLDAGILFYPKMIIK